MTQSPLHCTALTHLDNRNAYVRMLFIDYSSAFNTIVLYKLFTKLGSELLPMQLGPRLPDPQVVKVCNITSSTLILNTGAPQGCVLIPCIPNSVIKFADDTTVVGLITKNNKTAYRKEVGTLIAWCQVNNLSLNISKTKELIVDFRRNHAGHVPILINRATVEMVNNFIFLYVHISEKLKWSNHMDIVVKKARQRLLNLRMLKKFGLSTRCLTVFYRGTIKSILSGCITAWYSNSTAADCKSLNVGGNYS
ncbi:uncharacterized protein LOC116357768 [Oncorhynchus kisutch]|uniref:uncharacterized protein LOC116357768 n=1 Tax=Oncorhynchus kisutch TaxID=8019 RepID=UPI0012DF0FBB|nr:uncharacterized protein LOC116357768 [Oncorhynchus kisutch]XP_031662243.1 uncharacterized protein LOC116357768 [Oncorhynchus kisutch]XP_031662244.1 uncharacterized protein LOC116357768 [Oncorhynchus kisutch]